MSVEGLPYLLKSADSLAREAGKIIMDIYGSEFCVDIKDDKSPLTDADTAAHHCIVNGLAEFSDFPILSEEASDIPFSERSGWVTYWLVDPLDGTKEFIKRNGDFTVNIALIHNNKPVLGVVYIPVKQECYSAAEGVGAFKQSGNQPAQRINVRPDAPTQLVVAGSRSHVTPELEDYLDKLPRHELKSMGSSLKFCLVAEGEVDLYPRLGLTCEWDTAAAQCVVEQAGGAVCNTQGNRLTYNEKDSLLNPYFLVYGDLNHDWLQYLG